MIIMYTTLLPAIQIKGGIENNVDIKERKI